MNDTSITNEQLMTSLRYLIATGGSFAAGKGWVSPDLVLQLTPLLLAVGAFIWGLVRNQQQAKNTAAQVTQAVRVGAAAQADPNIPMSAPEHIGPLEAQALIGALKPSVVSATPVV